MKRFALFVAGMLCAIIAFEETLVFAQPAPDRLSPVVQSASRYDVSAPLDVLAQRVARQPDRPGQPTALERINRILPMKRLTSKLIGELQARGIDPATFFQQTDPVIQSQPLFALAMPATQQNFEGIPNVNNVLPPDTVGDVGYDPATGKRYYVQWVNWSYGVWDVTNTPTQLVQAAGNTLWNGFGGPCEAQNDGDPLVLYDQLANRWLLSQFALPNDPYGPFYTCLAVSTSANPTGSYYRYEFETTATKMNDYPHLGVWPDGYYMTVNQFNSGSQSWGGAGAFVFERSRMLNGQSARMVYFDLFNANSNFGGMLPTDLEGATLPPAGAPDIFAEVDDNSLSSLGPDDALRLWRFHVDWTNPDNSAFGVNGLPNATLIVAPFNVLPCTLYPQNRSCIPQPDGAPSVDAVGDRLMHRLTYRNFGDHETLLLNHTVDAGSGRAGIRWYEVRQTLDTPSIYQQGTYAPGDGLSRWMGSIAMDHVGNIALGYSVSSSSVYPSIRYAGRMVSDPLGVLAQGESSIIAGGGVQRHSSQRWGDYSSMNIDPVDDCTFWYTQEYYATTSVAGWQTRIASFRFPNCTNGATGVLRGTIRDANTSAPIPGAQVSIISAISPTIVTTTDVDGVYRQVLPIGVYTLTAAAYGYLPGIAAPVMVTINNTTTQDLVLTPSITYQVSGTVRDAGTTDPLYATITITGTPFSPPDNIVATDPATGNYSVTLAANQLYTFTVAAPLHVAASRAFALTSDRTENFTLISTTVQGGFIGWVKNLNTAQPVAQAQVILTPTGAVTLTNAAGYFEFLDLVPEYYTATVSAPLYRSAVANNVQVKPSAAAVRTLLLSASHLEYTPRALSQSLIYNAALTESAGLMISNSGQLSLTYLLSEVPDAAWLSVVPNQGTLNISSAQALTVTWNAAALEQPGVYTTSLYIDSNDPAAQNTAVPITLTVRPSTTMGSISGGVSTTGQCDMNTTSLAGATILMQNTAGFSKTTYTDAGGAYRYWLFAAGSPYSLTISASDQSVTSTVVAVTAGLTSTRDFTLRLQQPCLSVSPTTISVTANPGSVITPDLIVTNSGAIPLNFTIYEVSSTIPYGGPDAFGYMWRPTSYNWIEASDGTPLNLPDDGEVTIALPFAFPYYDRASRFLRVSNNGAVLFDAQTGDVSYVNVSMSHAPDDFLAPYWDDLAAYQGNVYWKTVGSAPDRRVVIEWYDRPHVNGDPGTITFEIVLRENGDVAFQYQTVNFGDPGDNAGASATIGIRGSGAAQSVEYSFARPSLYAQQAICFTRPGNAPCDMVDYPWLTVVPTTTVGLGGTPPQRQSISVTLNALSVPIGFLPSGAVRLISNDPAQRMVDIPVTFDIRWRWVYLPLVRK